MTLDQLLQDRVDASAERATVGVGDVRRVARDAQYRYRVAAQRGDHDRVCPLHSPAARIRAQQQEGQPAIAAVAQPLGALELSDGTHGHQACCVTEKCSAQCRQLDCVACQGQRSSRRARERQRHQQRNNS